jgi:hypothetical protein
MYNCIARYSVRDLLFQIYFCKVYFCKMAHWKLFGRKFNMVHVHVQRQMYSHIVVACFKQGKTIWLYKYSGILWLAEQLLASEGRTLLIVVVFGYQHFRVTCCVHYLSWIYLPQTLVSTWQTTSYLPCHKTMWYESTHVWEYQILCWWRIPDYFCIEHSVCLKHMWSSGLDELGQPLKQFYIREIMEVSLKELWIFFVSLWLLF